MVFMDSWVPFRDLYGHMDTLVNLPAVASVSDWKALRRLCDDVESHRLNVKPNWVLIVISRPNQQEVQKGPAQQKPDKATSAAETNKQLLAALKEMKAEIATLKEHVGRSGTPGGSESKPQRYGRD